MSTEQGIKDLRNKLKPVNSALLAEQDKKLNEQLGKKDSNYSSDLHKIEDGKNVFRIYPPHDQLDQYGKPNSFAEPKVVSFVPGMVADRDGDGNPKKDGDGNFILKKGIRPVFNSKIHGKKDKFGESYSKDLIEEFIRIAHEKSKLIDIEDERKKYLAPIYGVFISKGHQNNINGINYQSTWEAYADKLVGENWKLSRLEIKKAVKNRMNKIAATESSNDPLGTDPFTDLDTGRPLIIIYNSDAKKPEDYYQADLDNSTEEIVLEGGRKVKALKEYPISDERVMEFFKQEPLAKIFRNVFTNKDLDIQLQGLKMVDENFKMGIFETEEFQSIYEEILEIYPPSEEEESTTETTTSHSETKEVKTVRTDLLFDKDADDFSLMTREELIDFSKVNETKIIIKPISIMSDDDLRERLREWFRVQTTTSETVTEDKVEVVEEKTEEIKPLTAKEKLELLQKKKSEQQ